MNYNFPLDTLKNLHKSQMDLFVDEFEKIQEEVIKINYKYKSFKVNKDNSVVDSKIQSIGFFSGAGGLDIGAQLAGSKVISSLDFDLDSVKTLKSNKRAWSTPATAARLG